MAIGEFSVVEFDVSIKFFGNWFMGLEAFYDKNDWAKAR